MSCLYLLFLCCLTHFAYAQDENAYTNKEDQKMFESGKVLFDEKLYVLAYEHFDNLLNRHPKDNYLKYLKGICAIFISDKHDEALELLSEVKAKNPKAADIDYYFALYYHKTYQFDKSLELAEKLLENPKLELDQKKKLGLLILHCENAKEVVSNRHETQIANLGGPPNSDGDEYSPVLSADEQTLFFTYRGKLCKGGLRDFYDKPNEYGFYYEDIYMSRKVNGVWQEPEGLENVNTVSNEAALAISNDGQELFIYRANEEDGGDIYVSRFDGKEFGKPERLKGAVNTNNWEGSISLSGDGKKIIFASDRPGGYGGKDLYEAVKTGENTWGKVKNLGFLINTPYDEDGPFIHPDGRSLVFSSEGHNSVGDYDIFLSELNAADSSWKEPSNVGFPINTTDDDIFYTLSTDGKRGYFSSSKTGGFGNKDLYVEEPVVFFKNSHLTVVRGSITENKAPYSCDIHVLVGEDGHHYGSFKSNPLTGNFMISLPAGRNYRVVFDHPSDSDRVVDIRMEKNQRYNEVNFSVNFGRNNASPLQQLVIANPAPEPTATTVIASTGTFRNNAQTYTLNLSRAELFEKFADFEIDGLKYQIQVGAYRKPRNFNVKRLEAIGPVKKSGIIKGNVTLLILDRDFNKWRTADEVLEKVRRAGQKDAFVTANYKGRRIYLKDLAKMDLWWNAPVASNDFSETKKTTSIF